MAAMPADRQRDVRIGRDFRIQEWLPGHERVVFRRDDEGRHRNAVHDAHRTGAMVVVVGAREAEMRRRVGVVELPHGADRPKTAEIERAGPASILAPHPALQIPHEVPLVQEIPRAFEGADAIADLENRRHRRHAAQRGRRGTAVLAGELQREVAPERVTGDHHRSNAIHRRQLADHVFRVGREPGMEQTGREMLGAAAVPLVQAYDAHAAGEGLGAEALHVVGVARAVEAMEREQRGAVPRPGLPVAVGEDARVFGDVEIAQDRGRQAREMPRVAPAVHRHPVPVLEAGAGNE
jgi:hypothetical protein